MSYGDPAASQRAFGFKLSSDLFEVRPPMEKAPMFTSQTSFHSEGTRVSGQSLSSMDRYQNFPQSEQNNLQDDRYSQRLSERLSAMSLDEAKRAEMALHENSFRRGMHSEQPVLSSSPTHYVPDMNRIHGGASMSSFSNHSYNVSKHPPDVQSLPHDSISHSSYQSRKGNQQSHLHAHAQPFVPASLGVAHSKSHTQGSFNSPSPTQFDRMSGHSSQQNIPSLNNISNVSGMLSNGQEPHEYALAPPQCQFLHVQRPRS